MQSHSPGIVIATIIILGALLVPAYLDGKQVESQKQQTTKRNVVRNSMQLYTDPETSCQYLGTEFGGLTPRLTPDGTHAGCLVIDTH
jgi:hypothetical protein